jgi:hypothetical protein
MIRETEHSLHPARIGGSIVDRLEETECLRKKTKPHSGYSLPFGT